MQIEEGIYHAHLLPERGRAMKKITELLEAETWMLVDKAVGAGFAGAEEVSETPEKLKRRTKTKSKTQAA